MTNRALHLRTSSRISADLRVLPAMLQRVARDLKIEPEMVVNGHPFYTEPDAERLADAVRNRIAALPQMENR